MTIVKYFQFSIKSLIYANIVYLIGFTQALRVKESINFPLYTLKNDFLYDTKRGEYLKIPAQK